MNTTVTVGCKVTYEQKKRLEQTAANWGMDKSTLLRKRILQDDEKLLQLSSLPEHLIIDAEHCADASDLMQQLQERYPKHSASQLLRAALKLALSNETHLLTQKIKKHLSSKK